MQAAAYTPPLVLHGHRRTPSLLGNGWEEYHELENQLADWFLKLSIHDQWSKSRLQNGRARGAGGAHVLRPLLTAANNTPHLFPLTLADLRALDLPSVLALLQAYEQPAPANIELGAARRAFARFIGAPPY